MKIIIDSAIPFIESVFEPYAEVVYANGGSFTPSLVCDADVLIIRTRTRCDAELLEGSKVRLIATATIGYDHIDMEYCHSKGIEVTTAAGCNARGVLQWFGAAMVLCACEGGWSPSQRRVGVVGVGNVGSLIAQYCRSWGFEVLCCDPPRAERGEEGFVSLDELLPRVDILTLHTPLLESTRHLINSENIKRLKPLALVVNTSRGECLETRAILENPQHSYALDVWEREPEIDCEVLRRSVISTPHIAGYSMQGKANGTAMVVGSVARHFGLPIEGWYPDVERNEGAMIGWEELIRSVSQRFDIVAESKNLKDNPEEFEGVRNSYNYRNEYF
ncbi:MAG: 4-phosphoerythronate dehydrogenase [Rikenellaceae bacterium]